MKKKLDQLLDEGYERICTCPTMYAKRNGGNVEVYILSREKDEVFDQVYNGESKYFKDWIRGFR